MAIQEAKQQHPDMLVTKAVVIRETESPTEEQQQTVEVCRACTQVHVSALLHFHMHDQLLNGEVRGALYLSLSWLFWLE